jgi:hypothetical protein
MYPNSLTVLKKIKNPMITTFVRALMKKWPLNSPFQHILALYSIFTSPPRLQHAFFPIFPGLSGRQQRHLDKGPVISTSLDILKAPCQTLSFFLHHVLGP